MSIRDFFNSCDNSVELSGKCHINWSVTGTGFGQFRLYTGEDGKIHIDNECMNRTFIKQVLNMLVDEAILDDDKVHQSTPDDIISDEGC